MQFQIDQTYTKDKFRKTDIQMGDHCVTMTMAYFLLFSSGIKQYCHNNPSRYKRELIGWVGFMAYQPL